MQTRRNLVEVAVSVGAEPPLARLHVFNTQLVHHLNTIGAKSNEDKGAVAKTRTADSPLTASPSLRYPTHRTQSASRRPFALSSSFSTFRVHPALERQN